MTMIMRDDGFHEKGREADITLPPDTPVSLLNEYLGCSVISIDFPSMTDGRGFSIAKRLRAIGYEGTLRATGNLIADQYAMSRGPVLTDRELVEKRDEILAALVAVPAAQTPDLRDEDPDGSRM